MAESLADVKYKVAVANRVLWATGLAAGVTASLGHASMRVTGQPDRFVVKGRGYKMDALSAMRPEDMVVCDLEGFLHEGPPGATQCFEVKMHSCIYKLYPEVQSVVHIHPRYTVLLTTLQQTIKPMCQEGVELVRHPLPVYPHMKIVVSDEEGMEVARLIGGHQAVLLQSHGATTTGNNLEQAVMNMMQLEEQARMNYQALAAVGPDYPSVPDAMVEAQINRPPLSAEAHFKEPMANAASMSAAISGARSGGVWQYYTELVSKDL